MSILKMERKLYLECNAGISGDMFTAALLDLGADEKRLRFVLDSVPIKGFDFRISRVKKSGIDCCDFEVLTDNGENNYDHDMAFLYGHSHDAESSRVEVNGHSHSAGSKSEDVHTHSHGMGGNQGETDTHYHHHGRGLREINEIIDGTAASIQEKQLAKKIFSLIADAEAKVHGIERESVHFHEVGALDSIADIIAAAVCFCSLGIDEVIVPFLSEGMGTIRCRHGILPVPVPATTAICEAHGIGLKIMNAQGEFVTPTGAAIAAAIRTSEVLPRSFKIMKSGYGAGKREHEIPGILRAFIIQ